MYNNNHNNNVIMKYVSLCVGVTTVVALRLLLLSAVSCLTHLLLLCIL